MNSLLPYLPVLVPVVLIELALMITALTHVLKHPNYRFGNRTIWIIVVVLFQIIGPVLYFAIGRGED
jgi:hypothetical protein